MLKNLELSCREFSKDEITYLSEAAKNMHLRKYLNEERHIVPELEQLFLVRATDVFPQDSVIIPVSKSSKTSKYEYDDESIIKDRITKKVCEKYGVTGVNTRYDFRRRIHDLDEKLWEKIFDESRNIAFNEFGVCFKEFRDTVHFAMNAMVSDNGDGSWKNKPFVFMEPYHLHQGEFDNIGSYDSWKTGNFELRKPILLVGTESMKNLIEIAEKDNSVLKTLKNCEIMMTDLHENVKLEDFVRAVLHEKGAPAYYCKSSTSYAVDDDGLSVQADGLQNLLEKLAEKESTEEREVTSNQLHSLSKFGAYEEAQKHCQIYSDFLIFAKFIAQKLNNNELLESLKQFELPKTRDEFMEYCVKQQETMYERFKNFSSGNFDSKVFGTKIKSTFIKEIEKLLKPYLINMDYDQLREYTSEFNKSFMKSCEAVYGKSIVFKKGKVNEKTLENGEKQPE